jgi:cyclopropane-fatty-acyl-phospholipid synthase
MWGENLLMRVGGLPALNSLHDRLERFAAERSLTAPLPLAIALPDGRAIGLGAAPRVTVRVHDAGALVALVSRGLGALADAFVRGEVDVDGDALEAVTLLDRLGDGLLPQNGATTTRPRRGARRHLAGFDAAAIRHHYDVGNDFYALWLDARMVYSCAYFEHGDESLDVAQEAKLDHICRKLRLRPGQHLLDVGCGWGGLVLHAAQRYGVRATGITLSPSQHAWAQACIDRAGLGGRVVVERLDYRELPARFGADAFDAVASVGMFEHVGLRQLPSYFAAVGAVLRDRGLFLNHGITSSDVDSRPVGGGVGEFIERHVFPGGELPHLHVAVREMSAAAFEIADVESLRPHYATTLRHWSSRLEARRDEAARLVPEQTLRVWRAYLAGCSLAFDRGWINVHQLLGSRQMAPGPTALPRTRAWIYARGDAAEPAGAGGWTAGEGRAR